MIADTHKTSGSVRHWQCRLWCVPLLSLRFGSHRRSHSSAVGRLLCWQTNLPLLPLLWFLGWRRWHLRFPWKTENMVKYYWQAGLTDWVTYLGEKFELWWCDQNIGSHPSREHHLGILLPLNRCSLIAWVQWVKSALLEYWLDTLLNLATLKALVVSRCTQVLDNIGIDDSEGHLVDSEHLRVGQHYRIHVLGELRSGERRLRQRVHVVDLTSWWN